MTRSSSEACNSVAISVTAWRWWPDCRRPTASSTTRRRRWLRATRFAWRKRHRRPSLRHRRRHRPGNEVRVMRLHADIPFGTRDVRLDLSRGLANWAIFLDHIPHEVLNWTTSRNYGFSDAADLFVFVSGYTAALAFGRMMVERGYLVAASRLSKRAFELYAALIIAG